MALVLEQARDHLAFQQLELTCVPEKLRDADEKIVEELLGFVRLRAQSLDVAGQAGDLGHLHASLDPAQERAVLVAVEIVPGFVAQNRRDAGQGRCRLFSIRINGGGCFGRPMADACDDPFSKLVERKNSIGKGRRAVARRKVT